MPAEYQPEEFCEIVKNYKRIFGDGFFSTLQETLNGDWYGYNLLISNPEKITFNKTKAVFDEMAKRLIRSLSSHLKPSPRGRGFLLG